MDEQEKEIDRQRKEIIEEIQNALLSESELIRADGKPILDKLGKIEVINNTIKFLDNYDENIKALNKYLENKRREER